MGNKLYVGNLPYSVRDEDLQQSFSQFGSVTSAKVMMERDTGRSKGFGFVEMGSDAEAQAAINGSTKSATPMVFATRLASSNSKTAFWPSKTT
jgi:RNA recognition motif-containing protein